MANAKKCDRCEKYYDTNHKKLPNYGGYIFGVALVRTSTLHRYGKEFDLCDDCLNEFMRFLDGAELEEPNDLYLD